MRAAKRNCDPASATGTMAMPPHGHSCAHTSVRGGMAGYEGPALTSRGNRWRAPERITAVSLDLGTEVRLVLVRGGPVTVLPPFGCGADCVAGSLHTNRPIGFVLPKLAVGCGTGIDQPTHSALPAGFRPTFVALESFEAG